MQMLKAGDIAPQFSLPDQNNQMVSLNDYMGKKVLLYFYPKAMTPGCTIQAQGLRDSQALLAKLNVEVIGVSPDAVRRLPKFIERENLNFTLLSDEAHVLADKFGVWGLKKFMGKEYDGIHRITFLINENGNIEHVFNKFKTKNHHEVVLAYLQE